MARREVPITSGLARKLWELRKQATQEGCGDDRRPIFASKAGTPLSPSNVLRAFKPATRTRRCAVGRSPLAPPYMRDNPL
jgi:hypothetical protein